jgi:hypothetical protein
MFSPGIPLLIPLGFLNILVIYSIEKFKLAYFYRQPPMITSELSDRLINILKFWGPALYCTFGFWMYSNRQAFVDPFHHDQFEGMPFKTGVKQMESTIVVPTYNRYSVVYTNHTIFNSLTSPSPGWLYLIPLIVLFWSHYKESIKTTISEIRKPIDRWEKVTELVTSTLEAGNRERFYDVIQEKDRQVLCR